MIWFLGILISLAVGLVIFAFLPLRGSRQESLEGNFQNKTEAAIGYYTKYGDGAVDVEPIADLYKTEVWEVGRILGVPQRIIDKKPSAELWEGHTDEDELGMTYQKIDEILSAPCMNEALYMEKYGEDGKKVAKLVKNSEHKRHMPPAFKVR